MGKLSRGFLGGFQGQLGTAYGSFWRLMDLIKAMPRKVKRPATAAQLPVQMRLKIVTSLLADLSTVIKVGFQDAPKPKSAMNAAVAYNLENAITGAYPDFSVDFTKLRFSQGKCVPPVSADVANTATTSVKYTWQASNPGTPNSEPTDKLTFIVYNPEKDQYVIISGVISRSALSYELVLPSDFSGDQVHCYISAVSADGKLAGKSMHLGALTIS